MERQQQGSALTVADELLEKPGTKLAALGDTRAAVYSTTARDAQGAYRSGSN